MFCSAVGQIVAIHRCHHDMFEAQLRNRLGDALRFFHIECTRQAGFHIAKGTSARAGIAHDHHGGVTVGPAFADIGATRLFADRV